MMRDDGEKRADAPGETPSPAPLGAFPFPPQEGRGHSLRFYGSEQALSEAAADFATRGSAAGEGVLVLASPRLAAALAASLPARGLGAGAGITVHDSGAFLAGILSSDGRPDEDLFNREIAPLAARASAGRRGLRIFSDFWDPLRERGARTALDLEALWSKLGGTLAFFLLCAYPLRGFRGDPQGFGDLCAAHDSVAPEETFRMEASAADRMRQVADMQRRIAELEGEPERRGRGEDGSGPAAAEPESRLEAAPGKEAASAEGAKRFRDLADSVPVLIWAAAPDGKREYVNRRWTEFTGDAPEPGADRWMEGIHPEDRPAAAAALARALETRSGYRDEFRLRRRDGAWRWMLNIASPRLGPDGGFLGMIGSCVDVTERREAEELARRERSLEAVGRLASGLAHDFNNLLTAINGYSEIGLTLAAESGPLRDALTEIQSAGTRAAALTRQLLAYGRKQPMAPVVFDLDAALDEMEPILRRLLGRDIKLERARQKGMGLIQADPGQVRQLLLTLLLNAREAMPAGGTLTLETADGMARPGPDQVARPYVTVAVRDTGAGMADPIRERVFDPYFTTKDSAPGNGAHTGLGLSGAYGAVRQSGGFLSATGEPGRGSVFRAHFPWIEPEAGKMPGPDAAGRPAALLAVADPESRRYLARALADEGFGVAAASDGDEALSLAQASPRIDLLVADSPPPRTSRTDFAARLRTRHPQSRVLFISGSEDPAGATAAPGVRFLSVPFTRAELAALARETSAVRNPPERPAPFPS